MADFYAAENDPVWSHPDVIGKHESWSDAISDLSRRAPSFGTPTVLLDLNSVRVDDETEIKRLLNDCPLISAIFKLGVLMGRNQP